MADTELIERLEAPDYWMSGSSAGHEGMNSAPVKAAAELRRLSTECEALREALGEAFSTLIYIFECSDDNQASRAAKEAADKVEAALQQTNKEGEG